MRSLTLPTTKESHPGVSVALLLAGSATCWFGALLVLASGTLNDPLRAWVGFGLILTIIPFALLAGVFMGPPKGAPKVAWGPPPAAEGRFEPPQGWSFDLSPYANRFRSSRFLFWSIGIGLGVAVGMGIGSAPRFGALGANFPQFLNWPEWLQWSTVVAVASLLPVVFVVLGIWTSRPGASSVVVSRMGVTFLYAHREPVMFPFTSGSRDISINDRHENAPGTFVPPGIYFDISNNSWEPLTPEALESILTAAARAGLSVSKLDQRETGQGFRYVISHGQPRTG